ELLEKASALGNTDAMRNLGYIYYFGADGLPADFERAAELFAKSAEGGEARSQFDLGRMYYRGQGVGRDYDKAEKNFESAANDGYARAQMFLARMYYMGEGVARDPARAYYWAALAAAQEKDSAEVYPKKLRAELPADTRATLDAKVRAFRPRGSTDDRN